MEIKKVKKVEVKETLKNVPAGSVVMFSNHGNPCIVTDVAGVVVDLHDGKSHKGYEDSLVTVMNGYFTLELPNGC